MTISSQHRLRGPAEELASLRALTARFLRRLELTPKQAAPPGPAQPGFFEAPPGPVGRRPAPEVRVDFFAALFAARTHTYVTQRENAGPARPDDCRRCVMGGARTCGTRTATLCS